MYALAVVRVRAVFPGSRSIALSLKTAWGSSTASQTKCAGLSVERTTSYCPFDNALKQVMKPEFINRIDEIVVFTPLEKSDVEKIADIMLKNLEKRLEDHGITLEISEEAKAHLVDKGYDKEYGARPMRRTIQRQVEDKLSEEILKGNISDNGKVKITLVDGQLDFSEE